MRSFGIVTFALGTILACPLSPTQVPKATSPAPSQPTAKPTGLLYDDVYLKHLSGNSGHPERPERLIFIREALEKAGLMQSLYPIHPRRVTEEELELVHKPSYIALVRKELSNVQGYRELSTGDTLVSKDSLEAAEFAAGGVLNAVDAVVEAPFGAAPHECFGVYEPMMPHMEAYVAKVNAEPVEGMRDYLDRHVYGPKTWTDFLSLIGLDGLLEAANKGRSIYND